LDFLFFRRTLLTQQVPFNQERISASRTLIFPIDRASARFDTQTLSALLADHGQRAKVGGSGTSYFDLKKSKPNGL